MPGADQRNLGALNGARKGNPLALRSPSIPPLWLEWESFARPPRAGGYRSIQPLLRPSPRSPCPSHSERLMAWRREGRVVAHASARARCPTLTAIAPSSVKRPKLRASLIPITAIERSDLPPILGQGESHSARSKRSTASSVAVSGGAPTFPFSYLETLEAMRRTSETSRIGR